MKGSRGVATAPPAVRIPSGGPITSVVEDVTPRASIVDSLLDFLLSEVDASGADSSLRSHIRSKASSLRIPVVFPPKGKALSYDQISEIIGSFRHSAIGSIKNGRRDVLDPIVPALESIMSVEADARRRLTFLAKLEAKLESYPKKDGVAKVRRALAYVMGEHARYQAAYRDMIRPAMRLAWQACLDSIDGVIQSRSVAGNTRKNVDSIVRSAMALSRDLKGAKNKEHFLMGLYREADNYYASLQNSSYAANMSENRRLKIEGDRKSIKVAFDGAANQKASTHFPPQLIDSVASWEPPKKGRMVSDREKVDWADLERRVLPTGYSVQDVRKILGFTRASSVYSKDSEMPLSMTVVPSSDDQRVYSSYKISSFESLEKRLAYVSSVGDFSRNDFDDMLKASPSGLDDKSLHDAVRFADALSSNPDEASAQIIDHIIVRQPTSLSEDINNGDPVVNVGQSATDSVLPQVANPDELTSAEGLGSLSLPDVNVAPDRRELLRLDSRLGFGREIISDPGSDPSASAEALLSRYGRAKEGLRVSLGVLTSLYGASSPIGISGLVINQANVFNRSPARDDVSKIVEDFREKISSGNVLSGSDYKVLADSVGPDIIAMEFLSACSDAAVTVSDSDRLLTVSSQLVRGVTDSVNGIREDISSIQELGAGDDPDFVNLKSLFDQANNSLESSLLPRLNGSSSTLGSGRGLLEGNIRGGLAFFDEDGSLLSRPSPDNFDAIRDVSDSVRVLVGGSATLLPEFDPIIEDLSSVSDGLAALRDRLRSTAPGRASGAIPGTAENALNPELSNANLRATGSPSQSRRGSVSSAVSASDYVADVEVNGLTLGGDIDLEHSLPYLAVGGPLYDDSLTPAQALRVLSERFNGALALARSGVDTLRGVISLYESEGPSGSTLAEAALAKRASDGLRDLLGGPVNNLGRSLSSLIDEVASVQGSTVGDPARLDSIKDFVEKEALPVISQLETLRALAIAFDSIWDNRQIISEAGELLGSVAGYSASLREAEAPNSGSDNPNDPTSLLQSQIDDLMGVNDEMLNIARSAFSAPTSSVPAVGSSVRPFDSATFRDLRNLIDEASEGRAMIQSAFEAFFLRSVDPDASRDISGPELQNANLGAADSPSQSRRESVSSAVSASSSGLGVDSDTGPDRDPVAFGRDVDEVYPGTSYAEDVDPSHSLIVLLNNAYSALDGLDHKFQDFTRNAGALPNATVEGISNLHSAILEEIEEGNILDLLGSALDSFDSGSRIDMPYVRELQDKVSGPLSRVEGLTVALECANCLKEGSEKIESSLRTMSEADSELGAISGGGSLSDEAALLRSAHDEFVASIGSLQGLTSTFPALIVTTLVRLRNGDAVRFSDPAYSEPLQDFADLKERLEGARINFVEKLANFRSMNHDLPGNSGAGVAPQTDPIPASVATQASPRATPVPATVSPEVRVDPPFGAGSHADDVASEVSSAGSSESFFGTINDSIPIVPGENSSPRNVSPGVTPGPQVEVPLSRRPSIVSNDEERLAREFPRRAFSALDGRSSPVVERLPRQVVVPNGERPTTPRATVPAEAQTDPIPASVATQASPRATPVPATVSPEVRVDPPFGAGSHADDVASEVSGAVSSELPVGSIINDSVSMAPSENSSPRNVSPGVTPGPQVEVPLSRRPSIVSNDEERLAREFPRRAFSALDGRSSPVVERLPRQVVVPNGERPTTPRATPVPTTLNREVQTDSPFGTGSSAPTSFRDYSSQVLPGDLKSENFEVGYEPNLTRSDFVNPFNAVPLSPDKERGIDEFAAALGVLHTSPRGSNLGAVLLNSVRGGGDTVSVGDADGSSGAVFGKRGMEGILRNLLRDLQTDFSSSLEPISAYLSSKLGNGSRLGLSDIVSMYNSVDRSGFVDQTKIAQIVELASAYNALVVNRRDSKANIARVFDQEFGQLRAQAVESATMAVKSSPESVITSGFRSISSETIPTSEHSRLNMARSVGATAAHGFSFYKLAILPQHKRGFIDSYLGADGHSGARVEFYDQLSTCVNELSSNPNNAETSAHVRLLIERANNMLGASKVFFESVSDQDPEIRNIKKELDNVSKSMAKLEAYNEVLRRCDPENNKDRAITDILGAKGLSDTKNLRDNIATELNNIEGVISRSGDIAVEKLKRPLAANKAIWAAVSVAMVVVGIALTILAVLRARDSSVDGGEHEHKDSHIKTDQPSEHDAGTAGAYVDDVEHALNSHKLSVPGFRPPAGQESIMLMRPDGTTVDINSATALDIAYAHADEANRVVGQHPNNTLAEMQSDPHYSSALSHWQNHVLPTYASYKSAVVAELDKIVAGEGLKVVNGDALFDRVTSGELTAAEISDLSDKIDKFTSSMEDIRHNASLPDGNISLEQQDSALRDALNSYRDIQSDFKRDFGGTIVNRDIETYTVSEGVVEPGSNSISTQSLDVGLLATGAAAAFAGAAGAAGAVVSNASLSDKLYRDGNVRRSFDGDRFDSRYGLDTSRGFQVHRTVTPRSYNLSSDPAVKVGNVYADASDKYSAGISQNPYFDMHANGGKYVQTYKSPVVAEAPVATHPRFTSVAKPSGFRDFTGVGNPKKDVHPDNASALSHRSRFEKRNKDRHPASDVSVR